MGYPNSKRERLKSGLKLLLLPIIFPAAVSYYVVLRPIGRGAREGWREFLTAAKHERKGFRPGLKFLREGIVWIFTGRDLTTPRLQAEQEARREAFFAAKLGKRYRGARTL